MLLFDLQKKILNKIKTVQLYQVFAEVLIQFCFKQYNPMLYQTTAEVAIPILNNERFIGTKYKYTFYQAVIQYQFFHKEIKNVFQRQEREKFTLNFFF